MRTIVALAIAALAIAGGAGAATAPSQQQQQQPEVRSLDGSGNNVRHPDWGQTFTQYLRVADPNYADGVSQPVSGPSARYIGNRIFNDEGQNLFSENGVTQWGWTWGQFLDHTFGLRDETPAENLPIPFDKSDPLEEFQNDVGSIDFARTPAAPGTGTSKHNPRQQINTVSSYIDAFSVYGGTDARLEWLRNGPVDGNMANNSATLMLPGGYLPHVTARGDASTAPPMDLMGQLAGNPTDAVVAGDVRANENIALTSVHTLMAREHNRIVGLLPSSLSNEQKFQIARRVVGAEEQYITYNEFLPSLGVRLAPYRGYDPHVNASLSDEFATVGYRMHSMVHGDFDLDVPAGTYSASLLATFAAEGIVVSTAANGDQLITIPLTLAFGNPDLLQQIGEGPLVASLANNSQYKNDEQIDNSMRSVLFQIPKPGSTEPCGTPVISPNCFTDVSDLGAIDIQRGRDHGMPLYNDMRRAYGLPPVRSFTDITGESTDQFPKGLTINTPGVLDFVKLYDINGSPIQLGEPGGRDRRHSPHDSRGQVEGDLRRRGQGRRVRRDGLREARSGHRVRPTPAGHVDEAVRRTPRRRPLLLRERSGARSDPAAVRSHVQGDALAAAQARRGGVAPGERVQAALAPEVTEATIQRRGEVSEWSKERDWKSRRC